MTPPTDQDPNPPAWLANVVSGENTNQASVYASNVKIYIIGIGNWIQDNIINRANGRAITQPPTPPQLITIYAAIGNLFGQYTNPIDPTLPQAILPPPVSTSPSEPILGPASPNSGGSDPVLTAMYALVQKIAAAMGIKA
jgi:hypothetical protein